MPTSNRVKPMEVICLGLCRTGTQSLADALELLGYGRTYHMREVGIRPQHAQFWTVAISKKLGLSSVPCNTYSPSSPLTPSNPFMAPLDSHDGGSRDIFSRESFDRFLGPYQGCADIPTAFFPLELMKAYPEAKIVLTTRPTEAWMKSMRSTILHSWARKDRSSHPMKDLSIAVEHAWNNDFDKFGEEFFLQHNESVRQLAKELGREIYEFDVSEGWEGLCQFLGKEEPPQRFPKQDHWVSYKQAHGTEAYAKVTSIDVLTPLEKMQMPMAEIVSPPMMQCK